LLGSGFTNQTARLNLILLEKPSMNLHRLTYAFALSAMALSAQAVNPTVETTGMVGIADAQTAQLNLLNAGIQPPAMGLLCSAFVSFVDSTGKVLKSATLTIPPGQSMPFTLRSDKDLNLVVVGDRVEIRATVTTPGAVPVTTTSTSAVPACKLVPTLEILDTASGRTLVTLGHVVAVPPGPSVTP
jgi:hypothetical protein